MNLKKRLDTIIQKDKNKNQKYLVEILKSDIYYLLNNYFEADFDQINVNIEVEEDKYLIEINALAERIKTMKVLPE